MAINSKEKLIAQLRESFGHIVYAHKTHEKMADIYHSIDKRIKSWQLILSVVVTSGIVTTIGFEMYGKDNMWIKILSAAVSFALMLLTTYMRNGNYSQLSQQHKETAADLWLLREKYLCLLADYEAGLAAEQETIKRRDRINDELSAIYKNAPRTTRCAYEKARKALKENEEMTFSDEEIDAFLPETLRKIYK